MILKETINLKIIFHNGRSVEIELQVLNALHGMEIIVKVYKNSALS